jgi:hypothetical protein
MKAERFIHPHSTAGISPLVKRKSVEEILLVGYPTQNLAASILIFAVHDFGDLEKRLFLVSASTFCEYDEAERQRDGRNNDWDYRAHWLSPDPSPSVDKLRHITRPT